MGDSGSTTLLNSPSKLTLSSLLPRREGPWDFPGSGPVVKTVSNAGGVGSIPGQGTKIPSAMWWCGQKKKKRGTSKTDVYGLTVRGWDSSHIMYMGQWTPFLDGGLGIAIDKTPCLHARLLM